MKYIVLQKDELSNSIKASVHTDSLTSITDSAGSDTGFYIAKVADSNNSDALRTYRRFTKDQLRAVVNAIRNSQNPNRKILPSFKHSAFQDPEGKRARFSGAFKMTVPAGEVMSQDFILADDRFITGGLYQVQGSNFGDRLDFDVVHPVAGVIDNHVSNWYVWDGATKLETYPAKLTAGLILRLTYTNVGSNEASVLVNLILHKAT
jgi:hypothetical protein